MVCIQLLLLAALAMGTGKVQVNTAEAVEGENKVVHSVLSKKVSSTVPP